MVINYTLILYGKRHWRIEECKVSRNCIGRAQKVYGAASLTSSEKKKEKKTTFEQRFKHFDLCLTFCKSDYLHKFLSRICLLQNWNITSYLTNGDGLAKY